MATKTLSEQISKTLALGYNIKIHTTITNLGITIQDKDHSEITECYFIPMEKLNDARIKQALNTMVHKLRDE